MHFFLLALLSVFTTTKPTQLDADHLLLDGNLSDAEVAERPFTYNDFKEAARHFGDSTTLYIAPDVYWIDNPDSPEVVTGKNGREPFGMTIKAKKLHFIGLSQNAEDVVLASQRGQMQGAVGNFTMFNFITDSLIVENMTMGNYCNVDLDYKRNPQRSRQKRSDAITQAHVGYVRGSFMEARNVRFISRLNLNPLNGARHSYYENCHFECTDDALNGNAVYRHCTIDLYGSKPFWSTHGHGALFIDCDFTVKSRNREMYFMKQGGPLTLVNCRYHAPSDSIYIGWTPYPQRYLRCYQQDFTLNGKPYIIGTRNRENTIITQHLSENTQEPPFVEINHRNFRLRTGQDSVLLKSDAPSWRVPEPFQSYVRIQQKKDGILVIPANNTDEMAVFCIESFRENGETGACELTIEPSKLSPPAFLSKPRIIIEGDSAKVKYKLDMNGRRDLSRITWYRDDIAVSTSHMLPQRSYLLTEADKDHLLTAKIEPRHQRSDYGTAMEASHNVRKEIAEMKSIVTDFHDFPCQWQSQIKDGYWTVDGYKPEDTKAFDWAVDNSKPMWEYGKGFNGAVGYGLLQAQRGARLMYTPIKKDYGDMTLILQVDPTKTAGQGFGSATGQYMDVCLKFDTQTLSGYGLRIIRTTKHAKAVDFFLVEYASGKVTALTEPVSATCYRTGCTIKLTIKGNQLAAHVLTLSPAPAESRLPHEVKLKSTIKPSVFGGIHIQHTGSCGESTTMFHRLEATWP